jgi:4-hydroxybenzoyl-CoA thioesterase
MDGYEHFLVTGQQLHEDLPSLDAHRPQEPAFRATTHNIAAWATDHTGCLQVSRFFELVNSAVEQWFEDSLGMPFRDLHMTRGLGIPTVEMNTRCRALPRIGDLVTMWVRPTKIGSRALVFTCWLVGDDGCLVENEQAIVFVKMTEGGFDTITIPDDIRSRLETQLQTVK